MSEHCREEALTPGYEAMTDIAISVFALSNRRGYLLPSLNIHYQEINRDCHWTVVAGGTRAYVVRFGNPLQDDPGEQAADSSFMVRRLTTSLLLGGLAARG